MKRWCAILLLQSCTVLGGRAWGQTCGVTATAMAFGNGYQPLIGTAVTTTSTVTVTCNPGVVALGINYTITLGPGTGGPQTARRMSTGTVPNRLLSYQIYKDSGMTQVWGDGTGGTFTNTNFILLGLIFPIVTNFTAYGIIPANTQSSVGMFNDMVLVTITY